MIKKDIILKQIGKIIIPLIQLFGLYIIINGHISPGGGFSGGAVLGTSFIIMNLIYGEKSVENFLSKDNFYKLIGFSIIFYALVKGYSFLSDIYNLPHPILGEPGYIFSGGFIPYLNISLGILVASVFYIIFSIFIRKEV
jgi:multicomponent Na+:H+ antiporter subunit B